MERVLKQGSLTVAAGTAGRVYFAPPDATRRWKLLSVNEIPRAASAANATNYATRALFKGASTALNTAVTTESTGLTQGTPVNATLTAVGTDLEITQAAPMSYRVTHTGSGVAVDVEVQAEFEEQRV